MKNLKILALVFGVIMLMSSCVKQEDISVNKIENISLNGFTRLDITLNIENRSSSNLTLQYGKLTLKDAGQPVADILLREPVSLGKKRTDSVNLSLQLKLYNPFAAMGLLQKIRSASSDLTISADVKAKAGWGKKKITLTDVPFSQFLGNFGADKNTLLNSFGI